MTLANGVFAGLEIAVVSMRRTRIQTLLEEKKQGAESLDRLRREPERFLATVQIGITVISTATAAFGGARVEARLEPVLAGIPSLQPHAEKLSFIVVVALISYLSLLLGELVPKSLALRSGEPYALVMARPLLALSWLARPLVWFLTASSNLVLRPFKDRTNFIEARLSREELQQIVGEAAKTGALDEHTSALASRVLDFDKLTAADIMVPRHRIVALPVTAKHDQIKDCLLEERRTRMPIYDGNLDNIVGYITAKDVLPLAWEGGLVVLRDVLRPVRIVTETSSVVDLLQVMRDERERIAIVTDEHGAVAGLVTFDDVVEELVGEVFSEGDRTVQAIVHEDGGGLLVRGDVPVRDVNRELDVPLEESEGVATVGGLCTQLAGGAVPQRGARLAANDGIILAVVGASPRVVRRVRVLPAPRALTPAAGTDEAGGPSAP